VCHGPRIASASSASLPESPSESSTMCSEAREPGSSKVTARLELSFCCCWFGGCGCVAILPVIPTPASSTKADAARERASERACAGVRVNVSDTDSDSNEASPQA